MSREIIERAITKLVEIEFCTRYDALGIEEPNTDTMCLGQCEGTGYVPIHKDDMSEPWHTLWLEQEEKHHEEDGYQFVNCPDCNGTGKRDGTTVWNKSNKLAAGVVTEGLRVFFKERLDVVM